MMPSDVGIIDTMIGFPHADLRGAYAEIRAQIRDTQTQDEFEMPVEYMFKAVPEKGFAADDDPVGHTLAEMDRWGVDIAMVSAATGGPADAALEQHPDRFVYGGYFPMGLSLERIMTELPAVGFEDDVWPKFLRGNAARVLGLPR